MPAASRADSVVYAFADDFVDTGIDPVADRVADHGFGGVALASVYHAARDVVPHNPKRAVVHRDEGVHYFEPDMSLYGGPLQPSPCTDGTAPFETVTAALRERQLFFQAWTVYLHNGRLAEAQPECAITNAFGDRYLTDLCPSNADVAAYAVELTADVARLRPELIVAESLHFPGFAHGYHHERAFVEITPLTAFLLSLCFCRACIAGASGVDGESLAARVREVVRAALTGTPTGGRDLDRAGLVAACGEPILTYLSARERTVAGLAADCARIARRAGVPFGFMDQTGALKGYATGEPSGPLAVDDGWLLGIDAADVSEAVDSYLVLTYAKDLKRVRADAAAYRRVIGAKQLRCVLRHGGPDVHAASAADELRLKVAAVHDAGATADFYHYGLMPLAGLTAAAQAIRQIAGHGRDR